MIGGYVKTKLTFFAYKLSIAKIGVEINMEVSVFYAEAQIVIYIRHSLRMWVMPVLFT